MQKADLDRVGLGEISLEQALKDGLIQVSGDGGRVSELFLMLDRFEPGFNIVTPVV
jgi:alkyl sulfatase BDS1-like metallo-beta-lactamase superfamily hydrolase